jgi:hypothetical protein
MLDFLKPRHLRYRSMEEWREGENITSFRHPENPKLEKRLRRQLHSLRMHLWKRHIANLPTWERKQMKEGTHPSMALNGFEHAKLIFEEFRERVAALPYVVEVTMVTRHLERMVFGVKVIAGTGWRMWQEHLPPFYRGFEVLVSVAKSCKPALTRESAEELIPNGMGEADVYARLGKNAHVTHGKNGTKSLTYLFHFPPPPPGVDPKIAGITVVISNGVVVDRQVGQ